MTDLVEVGYVAKAHGIRGELRVVCHNPESDLLERIEAVVIGGERFEIVRARASKDAYLVSLAGVTDRNRAETMKGSAVEVSRAALELDDDEVLLADLVGCRVELEDGTSWGEIAAIEAGPQDRLVIRDGGVERLLPLVDEFIVSIDTDAGVVVIAPPEGLPEG